MKKLLTILFILLSVNIYAYNSPLYSRINTIEDSIDRVERELTKAEKNKNLNDTIKNIVVPLFSIFLSIIVICSNEKQNREKNKLEIITKSRVEWINNLRQEMSGYVNALSELKSMDIINKYYNIIRVYFNPKENTVQSILKKMEFANELCSIKFENDDYVKFLIEVREKSNNARQNEYLRTLEFAKIDLNLLSEAQLKVISSCFSDIVRDESMIEKLDDAIVKKIQNTSKDLIERGKKISSRISKINKEIRALSSDNSNTIFEILPKINDKEFSKYIQKDICNNIARSFNYYLKHEWDIVKMEVIRKS